MTVWQNDKVAADQVVKAIVALQVLVISASSWRINFSQETQTALHSTLEASFAGSWFD